MSKIIPSTNIIRDTNSNFNYYVTPNAKRTVKDIFEAFNSGTHCFNIIGSFGTGKSSFLWAFEKTLKYNANYFQTPFDGNAEFVKIIGEFTSFKNALNEEFEIKEDFTSNQKMFDAIFQKYEAIEKKGGLLVIIIDEFGKFLEFAAKNHAEDEIYFIQKLAEFVNAPERNILLITSIHQSFESYSLLNSENNSSEWRKVKGRFKDLTFNEPIEQLVFLAASFLSDKNRNITLGFSNSNLINRYNLFQINSEYLRDVEKDLYPLSAISTLILTKAIQRYGQNERSLFTFLNSIKFSELEDNQLAFEMPQLYDYLLQDFYSFIISKNNPDYSNWYAIKNSLERAEIIESIHIKIAEAIIKTIGLLSIFSSKGARIECEFLVEYFKPAYSRKEILNTLENLEKSKVIKYVNFSSSYKLFEGTDLDIDKAINAAESKIDNSIDVLSKLNFHFDFPIITAKAISYKLGTPRLFEFILSNNPINKTPEHEIDGYINLIFNEKLVVDESLIEYSIDKPVLFGVFQNTTGIFETLLEIEKTNKVLTDMQGENDRVAIRELKSIIQSQEALLNHYVMDSLYKDKVSWIANGKNVSINNKISFNKELSKLCETVYYKTPVIQNELINRHKVSGSISSARKNFWKALVFDYDKEDLGFDQSKWPAEKTIYYTLLKKTGIHRANGSDYSLFAPNSEDIETLWEVSVQFLDDSKTSKKSLNSFIELLSKAPIKLKQGVIDFWIPTFLFIKRGDFALYSDNGFVPYIDENILYMMTRNPKEYEIKSFELNDLRLNLFNKYRDFLRQENKQRIDTDSFIESIRPLLIFYRDLTDYSKKTTSISKEAIKLREAISKAKDPEKTFFEDIPEALGYSLKDLANDNSLFEDYIIDFQNRIQEIKNSFTELLDRFEMFICNEIIGRKVGFTSYKSILQDRFKTIKEHQALTRHKIFLLRVNSNLNDRDSFLMSLSQALINKSLDRINDDDEVSLKEKMSDIVKELDNLVDLNKVKTSENEVLLKFELTSLQEGSKSDVIRVPKGKLKEMEAIISKLSKELDVHKNLKMPILVSLLKKELDKK